MIKPSQWVFRCYMPAEGLVHIIEVFTVKRKCIFLKWYSSYFSSKSLNCNLSPPTTILQTFSPEDGLCKDIYSYLASNPNSFQKDCQLLFKCQKKPTKPNYCQTHTVCVNVTVMHDTYILFVYFLCMSNSVRFTLKEFCISKAATCGLQ